MHMVNAARMCVPVQWRSNQVPTIAEWFSYLDKIASMEELVYTTEDRMHKYMGMLVIHLNNLT